MTLIDRSPATPADVSTQLPRDPTSASVGRRMVAAALGDADPDLLVDAQLLVSELVTNAVEHAASAPVLTLSVDPQRLRVEVADDDPTPPVRRDPLPGELRGRGLLLLDRLADRWGSSPTAGGKYVWFELRRTLDETDGTDGV